MASSSLCTCGHHKWKHLGLFKSCRVKNCKCVHFYPNDYHYKPYKKKD